MALIHNSKDSLYGGVNQQSAEFRQSTQVEEMVNAYPTINQGLLKRNPTDKLLITNTAGVESSVTYTPNMWTYEYDRGLAGDEAEKYAILVSDGVIEIVNIESGVVYNEISGIVFNDDSKDYMFPFSGANGYAATTVGDVTFITNKHVIPSMQTFATPEEPEGEDRIVFELQIKMAELEPVYSYVQQGLVEPRAPYILVNANSPFYPDLEYVYYGVTTFTIDGVTIVSKSIHDCTEIQNNAFAYKENGTFISYAEYVSNLFGDITAALSSSEYRVSMDSTNLIRVQKIDGTAVTFSYGMQFINKPTGTVSTITDSSYWITSVVTANSTETIPPVNAEFERDGYIWIKRADPTTGYNYSATVVDASGNVANASISNATTTEAAAEAISTQLNGNINFTSTRKGSVVKVSSIDGNGALVTVEANDSYGNQASVGWAQEIGTADELPQSMGYDETFVQVIGNNDSQFATYWLVYRNSQWRETTDPRLVAKIDPSTMPHTITRESDGTFVVGQYKEWLDRLAGDEDTNPIPSFISSEDRTSPTIKDIFFFKNRLGFMTSRTVVMSEVGEYGNFFRTTVAALIDSDRIDATVDSTKAISLEYATYLEDSVMLFADIQFKLSGGSILSPSNVQISQTSAYELNRNVRPVFMNDRIFFCVKRGVNTAVMEYFVSETSSAKSQANDITAHCQTYIPEDVYKLSGSAINNMLFITCRSTQDIVYVYKYYDSGNTRVQSAWFKWQFNGSVYNAFSFGRYLNILIARNESTAAEDWVVGSGIWEGDKLWRGDLVWIGSPAKLISSNQFEQMQITPKDYVDTIFIDDNRLEQDTSKVDGYSLNGSTLSDQVLERRNFTIWLTEESEFRFYHQITTGSIEYRLTTSKGLVYTATASYTTGEVDTISIFVPRYVDTLDSINDIQIIPSYTEANDLTVYMPEVYQEGIDTNMLPKLNNYGWFVDGVEIPASGDITGQGDWSKKFGESNIGSLISSFVNIGEWVLDSGGKPEIRGHLKFKTAQITSEDGSDFSLKVSDVKRGTSRDIQSKYTVDRKPMIYGDAKNIRIAIENNTSMGFRINTVSFEGNYNSRSRRT